MANPFVPFYIILPDGGTVLNYQINYPQGLLISPSAAATQFAASIVYAVGSGVPPPNNFSPRIGVPALPSTSLLSISVTSATFPSGTTVDENAVSHPQPSSAGGTVEWRGFFFTEIPNANVDRDAIQPRRWIDGFEIPHSGEGSGAGSNCFSRDASRTTEGMGYAFRSIDNSVRGHTLATSASYSWERFYMRIRALSITNTAWFWLIQNTIEGGPALIAGLTTAGTIEFYNKGNQVHPGTLIGTIAAPPLNTWFRLDLLFRFAITGVASGTLDVYKDGSRQFFAGVTTGGGLSTIQKHASSTIGSSLSITNAAEIDFDDWSSMDYPLTFTSTGLDWVSGSHIRTVLPSGFGTNNTGYSGDYRTLESIPAIGTSASVTASASGSILEVTTSYQDYALGCAALNVGFYAPVLVGTGTSELGIGVNGAAAVTTAKTVAQATWSSVIRSMGGITPTPITAVTFRYNKNSVGNEQVAALMGTAEYLGTFGPEDDSTKLLPPRTGVHNSPYWDQTFATSFIPPSSPVSVMSGTYTGNGTGQDIEVSTPIHWFWCRPLTSNAGGSHWWSSLQAGHDQSSGLPVVDRFIRAFRESSTGTTPGRYMIQISGNNAQSNANGVVYQWVGFSDIGMRYCLNGAAAHKSADTTRTNALVDANFLPEAAFMIPEAATGVSNVHYYKGPGHTTNRASPISTADVASVATFGTGTLTSLATTLNTDNPQLAFSCWRSSDGTGTGPVAITSYTGDGTGNRTITLTLGSRYPHFALVVPHNGMSYFRDPSFTGTASQKIDGTADASTAIRGGGVNQLLVGSALNTNAIVYDVFVLAGDTTGPNWSTNPTPGTPTVPVEPIFPVPTVVPTNPGAWTVTDTKGWWLSTNGFGGSATLITTPLNPQHPRHWDKIAAFATSTSGMLGGSPGAGVTYNNHLIYAGDDYTLSSTSPTIRIFDGLSDRLFATVPTVSGTVAKCIVSMILVGTTLYFTTLDSGTSASDFAGRVFALDILSANVVQVGSGFSSGQVPYTMVYHMGRLWLGTNKGNGTAGTVYFFRPGIDTAWTTDRTLSTDSAGGACSMFSYKGTLYVGCDAASGTASKVLARSGVGAWTTSHTAATTAQNNGHLSMMEFGGNLYCGYWNNASTSLIKKFDGTTWSTVYTGASTTIRPYIGMFVSDGILFVVGGGNALAASLISTTDGLNWSDNTAYLTGPLTETALPIFGVIGV